jgi:hypothetical protein
MGKDNIPIEMRRKFEIILDMDLDKLNDAYIDAFVKKHGHPPLNQNQPQLDEIYKMLIPELFEFAAEHHRRKLQ